MSSNHAPFRRWTATLLLAATTLFGSLTALAQSAWLEITLKVDAKDRPADAAVYAKYRKPFLKSIPGARSKALLVRDDDVQVLHGFASRDQAEAYLKSDLFTHDVVSALAPLLQAPPEVRIYTAN